MAGEGLATQGSWRHIAASAVTASYGYPYYYLIPPSIMKTTIEISDPLLQKARDIAARNGTTLKALVERGLQHVIEDTNQAKPFRLRKVSFRGKGLQAAARALNWDELRELANKREGDA